MTNKDYIVSLWENNYIQIPAVQGEAQSRTVNFYLKEEANTPNALGVVESRQKPINLTGCNVRLYFLKPDSTKVFCDGSVSDAENGVVTFILPYQTTTVSGLSAGQILITKDDGTTLKAIGIEMQTRASDFEGAIESTDDFSALVVALNEAKGSAAIAAQAAADSERAISNANQVVVNITANESARETAEQNRQAAESARATAEQGRVAAENDRVSAENTRVAEFSAIKSDAAIATANANASATSANTAAGAANTAAGLADAAKDNADAATAAANTAAGAANSAAQNADAAADRANGAANGANTATASATSAALTANTAAGGADTAAQSANNSAAAANTAASSANSAAGTANTAAQNAESKASAADTASQAATSAASAANTAADGANAAKIAANTAAETANAAAGGIDTKISAQKGQPNGIAGLDENAKVLSAQLPAMDYVPNIEKAAANGVATLDESGKLVQDAKTLNGYGTDNGSNSVVLSGRKADTDIGVKSTALGIDTTASGYYSFAEGSRTTASGGNSHAEGTSTIASGTGSHTEGGNTTASSIYSHAEGQYTTASGSYSHAEGRYTTASGVLSHAEGMNTTASGFLSHAEGTRTTASGYLSHVMGQYNKALTGEAVSFSATADAFVIGNGTTTDALSNAFRVTVDGSVYGLSAYNTTGADYSEYFEWFDGNPDAEDRVGLFVTLAGEKIKLANDGDYIVGVISGNPSIVGDHPSESWSERYTRDVYGRLVYEDINIPEEKETDEEGNIINVIPEHTETRLKANPEYDPTKEAEYQNREKRPEWSTVGMLGKLVVRDDGTCVVNGYCSPSNGIAMATASGYRVIARLDETHIKVLIK